MTDTAGEWVSCYSLAQEGLIPNKASECCGSCHADEEEGYSSLCEIDLADGREGSVCCAVAGELERRGLLRIK